MGWQSGDRVAGRFQIEGRLASGGMAEVYVARMRLARGVDRRVAIKRVHGHLSHDPEFVTMFLDEARVSSHLAHSGIVPVLDAVESRGELLLVLEYVRGWDLRAVLREHRRKGGAVGHGAAVQIARELAEILAYVHTARGADGAPLAIVHRDVTPSNLLIAEDGSLRLLDFGVARAASRATRTATDTLKGKLAYAAPEQLGGRVDARTDLYALGLTLFEMVTGRRALAAEDQLQAMARAQRPQHVRACSLRADTPGALDDLIARCLEVDPDDRPSSAREIVVRLEAIADAIGGANRSAVRALVQGAMGAPAREPQTAKSAFEGALAEVLGLGEGSTTGFVQTGERTTDPTAWDRPSADDTVADDKVADDKVVADTPSAEPARPSDSSVARPAPSRPRPLVWVGALATLAAAGGFAWALTTTEAEPAESDAELPAAGLLRVASEPNGATVTIDGRPTGQPTPTVVEAPAGLHRLGLTLDGYAPAARDVQLAAGANDALTVTLEAELATLHVRSRPTGALVTVASEERGRTPLDLEGLARAPTEVRLELDGYRAATVTAPLDVEREHTVDAVLTRRATHGLLNVSSTPWARVTVDGRVVAESTPAQRIRLRAGRHTVRLDNPRLGLRATRRVNVRAGATETLVVNLR